MWLSDRAGSCCEEPWGGHPNISVWSSISLKRKTKRLPVDKHCGIERNGLPSPLPAAMTRTQSGVSHWTLIKSVYAHVPINIIIQENQSCWKLKCLGWKIHLLGLDEGGYCLLCISSPERWFNPWSKWHWTYSNSTALIQQAMIFKKKASQKLGDSISGSEKRTAQWADKWLRTAQVQKQEPG